VGLGQQRFLISQRMVQLAAIHAVVGLLIPGGRSDRLAAFEPAALRFGKFRPRWMISTWALR